MKLKMPCKLCELSLDQQQKLGISNCTHSPFLPQIPALTPLPFGMGQMQNSPFLIQPLRDMMLAAYLFRGKPIKLN